MSRHGENIRRRSDGRWEARLPVFYPEKGTSEYKSFYGRTYAEARKKREEFLMDRISEKMLSPSEPEAGTKERGTSFYLPSDILFRDVAEGWLRSKKTLIKESSYAYYSSMVNNHIFPLLGDKPLEEIDAACLENYLQKQKVCGRADGGTLSDKTVCDLRSIVRQIFAYAEEIGLTDTVPAAHSVSFSPPSINLFPLQEQGQLERTILKENTSFGMGVLLSLYTGLRIGEVCALQWDDIDMNNGTLRVQKTIMRITDPDPSAAQKTKVVITSPKTACSNRTIPLPDYMYQYLLKRQKPGDRYLVTGTEHFMEPRACLRQFKRLLFRAGETTDYSFHVLRHTFATRCIENGVDIKSLSEIMGHSSVKITLQRYVHPSMDSKREQINKLPGPAF